MKSLFSKSRFLVIFFFGAISFFAFMPNAVAQEDVILVWNPSISEGVIGYRIYGKDYQNEYTDEGRKLYEGPESLRTCMVQVPGDRFTAFVATAFNSMENESGYSNEVVFEPEVLGPGKPNISIRRVSGS